MSRTDQGRGAAHREGLRLRPLLGVVVAWGFVTLIVVPGGAADVLWPLFAIPATIAALSFYAPGALVASAAALLALALSRPWPLDAPGRGAMLGLAVVCACTMVVGEHARRLVVRERCLREMVPVDETTGVLTEKGLIDRLEEEGQRCARYGASCALLRVSIRDYEAFVEKFGSSKAEAMLKRLAEVVRVTVRGTDLVGRLGEHDVGVLLLFGSHERCAVVAQRISEAVARTEFEGDSVEPVVTAAVRTSWAVCPDDGTEAAELIACTERSFLASVVDGAAVGGDGA